MTGTAAQVVALENERIRATRDGDFTALSGLCHPELIYVHSTGFTDSRESYLEKCRSGVYVYDEILCEIERTIVVDDTALVTETISGRVRVNGRPGSFNCRALSVWVRSANTWKILAYQPTTIPV